MVANVISFPNFCRSVKINTCQISHPSWVTYAIELRTYIELADDNHKIQQETGKTRSYDT